MLNFEIEDILIFSNSENLLVLKLIYIYSMIVIGKIELN